MANSLFVSHDGEDFTDCGDLSMPCRTVRHAVNMSNDGDEVYIDYAQGRPYMECENLTLQSGCYIELTKSVSFHGINGKAAIRCKKSCTFFKITSPIFRVNKIKFFNLVISTSSIAVELEGSRTELVFDNVLIRDNLHAIHSKYSIECPILITNSTFEDNVEWGINLACSNLSVNINSSIFKSSSISFRNNDTMSEVLQKTEIFVQNTVFDYQNAPMRRDMIAIKPHAAIFNITIIKSQIKNHNVMYRYKDKFSSFHIYDYHSHVRYMTFVFLSNLILENNNNWVTLQLSVVYFRYTKVNVTIRDSIFRNNTAALRIRVLVLNQNCKPAEAKVTKTFIENTTFVDNVYQQIKPNGAAAIYFDTGKVRVSSCRFLDNKAGENPYTGVVTISEIARVTFFNSYFENRQTKTKSTQLFVSGRQPIYFFGHNTFNLVALIEGQSVFMQIPTDASTGIVIKKNFEILCPQGYQMNLQRQCKVIKSGILCFYINARCEQCPRKTYTLERGKFIFNKSNDIQCQQCPRGGDCERGVVTAKPNFWGYETRAGRVMFLQCPPGYCCETRDCPSSDSCFANRSGTLCGQCPEGTSESLFSTQCISNVECAFNYSFILYTVTLLLLYLLFFLYHKEIVRFLLTSLFHKHLSSSSSSGNSGMIKIFFYYYQVCNLLRYTVDSPKNGQFIHYFQNVITTVMNLVLVSFPSLNCPLKNLRAVPKAVVLHSVGFCLLILLCILYSLCKLFLIFRKIKIRRRRSRTELQYLTTMSDRERSMPRKSTFSERVASAFTYISLLMYASSARLCLSLLQCVPVDDTHVLFLDGNIRCYQTFQYVLISYIISSTLPFCLVPVLGSYLLKLDRIGVEQFCAACIFPLPFFCFWMYLLLKNPSSGNQRSGNTTGQNDDNAGDHDEEGNAETQSLYSEDTSFSWSVSADHETMSHGRSKSAILSILVGPFRPHKGIFCFPSSNIPWEGFLIFRRLVLIIALTFVYDIQLRLFLALTLCAGFLFFHMFVNPFQRKRDNILESFSLSAHVVLCGLYLVKAVYYGEDVSSMLESLPVLNVIENILIVGPLSIVVIIAVLSVVIKVAFGLKRCALVLSR
jgi:hypothetical protein